MSDNYLIYTTATAAQQGEIPDLQINKILFGVD